MSRHKRGQVGETQVKTTREVTRWSEWEKGLDRRREVTAEVEDDKYFS